MKILLVLYYFIVLVPYAMIRRMFGYRYMDVAINTDGSSYWVDKRQSKEE